VEIQKKGLISVDTTRDIHEGHVIQFVDSRPCSLNLPSSDSNGKNTSLSFSLSCIPDTGKQESKEDVDFDSIFQLESENGFIHSVGSGKISNIHKLPNSVVNFSLD